MSASPRRRHARHRARAEEHRAGPAHELDRWLATRSVRARLMLGVSVGLGTGVMVTGTAAAVSRAVPAALRATTTAAQNQSVSESGLELKSTSKVRIMVGRETGFWLEGPGAEDVTKATFEFPTADGSVIKESDSAGTEQNPAVVHTFDTVGAELPIRVTVEKDGEVEEFETTLEVIAVDTVGQEVEPPVNDQSASGGGGGGSGDLPPVPDGVFPSDTPTNDDSTGSNPGDPNPGDTNAGDANPGDPATSGDADPNAGNNGDNDGGTEEPGADDPGSGDDPTNAQPGLFDQFAATPGRPGDLVDDDGDPVTPPRTIADTFALDEGAIRDIISRLDITDGLTTEEIIAVYRTVGNDPTEFIQLLLTNDRWYLIWDGTQFLVIDRGTGEVLLTQEQFPPELAAIVQYLDVTPGEAKSFDPGDGGLSSRLDDIFDDFGDADVEDTDIDVNIDIDAQDLVRDLLQGRDPVLVDQFNNSLADAGTDDDAEAIIDDILAGTTRSTSREAEKDLIDRLDEKELSDLVRRIDLSDGLSFAEAYAAYRLAEDGEQMVRFLTNGLTGDSQKRRSRNDDDDDSDGDDDDDRLSTDDPTLAYLLDLVDITSDGDGGTSTLVNTGGKSKDTIFQDLLGIVAPELLVGETLDGTVGGVVRGGFGADTYVLNGETAGSNVDLREGEDVAALLGRLTDTGIELGAGNDAVEGLVDMSGGSIGGGDGDDSVRLSGRLEGVLIGGGDGNDKFGLDGEMNNTTVNGDDGDDVIGVIGNGTGNRINGGEGDDQIIAGGNLTDTVIDLGEGMDQLVIADNFRGSITVLDPLNGRVEKDGDNLREQDTLLLQGDGWRQIDDRTYERVDADGNVIAKVTLGADRPEVEDEDPEDIDDVEYVGVVIDGKVVDVFRDIDPKVDSSFWDDVLSIAGPVLSVAAIVASGGTATALVIAGGVLTTANAIANEDALGAVLGIASIAGPALQIAGAAELGKTVGDVVNGVRAGTVLIQSGFDVDALLGALSYTLGVTGNQQTAIATDVVNTVGTAVKDGKITLDTAIELLSSADRISELANANQKAKEQGFTDDDFINALQYPDSEAGRAFWESLQIGPSDGPTFGQIPTFATTPDGKVEEWSATTEFLNLSKGGNPELYAGPIVPNGGIVPYNVRSVTFSPPGSNFKGGVTAQVGQPDEAYGGKRPLYLTIQLGASTTVGKGTVSDAVSVSTSDPGGARAISSKVALGASVPGGKIEVSVDPSRLNDLATTGEAKDIFGASATYGAFGANAAFSLKGSIENGELVWRASVSPSIGAASPSAIEANLTGSVTIKIPPDVIAIPDAVLDNIGTPIPGFTKLPDGRTAPLPLPGGNDPELPPSDDPSLPPGG
jgi:hypothetical protein